jgi:hypothetical protein
MSERHGYRTIRVKSEFRGNEEKEERGNSVKTGKQRGS